MLSVMGLRRVHARFLDSCRSLNDGRDFWKGVGPIRRWILGVLVPGPLVGLHPEGLLMLEALQWLEDQCRSIPIGEESIRAYHRRICPGAGPSGVYRRGAITVAGSAIPRAAPGRIASLMGLLDARMTADQKAFDAARPDPGQVLGSALHLYERIGLIHPFDDANGRVARLAANHLLRRYGLGYLILPPLSESAELMDVLQEAHRGNPDPLRSFAGRCIVEV